MKKEELKGGHGQGGRGGAAVNRFPGIKKGTGQRPAAKGARVPPVKKK